MRKQARKRCEAAVLVGALALVSGAAMAQTNSASATATAVVVTPITVTKTADMVVGNLVPGNGVVTLSPNGTRSKTGNAALSLSGATPAAAKFTVSGTGNNSFSINYTSTNSLSSGDSTMAVDWITDVGVNGSGKTAVSPDVTSATLVSGTATIWAGAAITVDNEQAPGTYTGSLGVTVAYD
jgi:hypothetical protein